jgi:NADH:ubiquinone oxidoreductase subunit E
MTKKMIVCTNFRANPNNPSCAGRGSPIVMAALSAQLAQENCPITVEESPCLGFCEIGPNLRLMPNGEFFHGVSDEKLKLIIKKAKHFLEQN